MITLTPRLKAVADFVPPGAVVADIGTDHAYVPAYLIENAVIQKAFACDKRKGPLLNARKTVKEHGLCGVTFVLSDGLNRLQEQSMDTIIIAGMGGEMIVKILREAPWCENACYRFVLQPMTKSDVLREYLYAQGFAIERETLASEGEKLYSVMLVRFCGERKAISRSFALLGPITDDPLFELKRKKELERLQKIVHSLKQKKQSDSQMEQVQSLIKEIEVYSW